MRARYLSVFSLLLACGPTTGANNDAGSSDAGPSFDGGDPTNLATGACTAWTISAPVSVAMPSGAEFLVDAIPSEQGALVGFDSTSPLGVQLVHLDAHGAIDEALPPIVPAPNQTKTYNIQFALAQSHGHAGVARYETNFGFAFTPIDLHGAITGPEVAVGTDPHDGYAHVPELFPAPSGFVMMDLAGGPSAPAERLDFTGAVRSQTTPIALLANGVWAGAVVTDDDTIIAVGGQPGANPAVADQTTDATNATIGATHTLLPAITIERPSLFPTNVGGVPMVTMGFDGQMLVAELNGDGSLRAESTSIVPPDGDCVRVAYAHGSVLCVTTSGQDVHVQAFGYDGTPRSSLLAATIGPLLSPSFAVAPTPGGALVIVDAVIQNAYTSFAVELSCVP